MADAATVKGVLWRPINDLDDRFRSPGEAPVE